MKKIVIIVLCVLGYTLGKAQVLTEEQNAKDLLQKAQNAYSNEFYELELEYYKEAETNYSEYFNVDEYLIMGATYDSLGNYNQAITCFQKAARLGDKEAQGF
jgi:tetratricopeptide (TPR) repeat protein